MANNVVISVNETIEHVVAVVDDGQENVTITVTGTGQKGDTGLPGGLILVTATQYIPAYSLVNSDGTIANSGVTGKRAWGAGVAIENIVSGFQGLCAQIGEVTNVLWSFTAGDVIYLNGTTLQNTPPTTGYSKQVGVAINNNTIVIELKQSILI